jgi:hypothetical protein
VEITGGAIAGEQVVSAASGVSAGQRVRIGGVASMPPSSSPPSPVAIPASR